MTSGQAHELTAHALAAAYSQQGLCVLLTELALQAPLPQAAAAACALAHHLLPLGSDASAGHRSLEAVTAEAVAGMLSRSGLVAAMSSCAGAEHAAGQLAALALEIVIFVPGLESQLMPKFVRLLAPNLLAVLAAPANCASGSVHALRRAFLASRLLGAVASDVILRKAASPDAVTLLTAAASFLSKLDRTMECVLKNRASRLSIASAARQEDSSPADTELLKEPLCLASLAMEAAAKGFFAVFQHAKHTADTEKSPTTEERHVDADARQQLVMLAADVATTVVAAQLQRASSAIRNVSVPADEIIPLLWGLPVLAGHPSMHLLLSAAHPVTLGQLSEAAFCAVPALLQLAGASCTEAADHAEALHWAVALLAWATVVPLERGWDPLALSAVAADALAVALRNFSHWLAEDCESNDNNWKWR